MKCKGCGNLDAYQVRVYADRKGGLDEICNACADIPVAAAATPDVYLGQVGQKFENLCDERGRPYEITSKRHKKEVMDRLGVSEVGDRVNGAPFGSHSWIDGTRAWRKRQFDRDRPGLREVYRQWREKHA